jgi:hypothetical protein
MRAVGFSIACLDWAEVCAHFGSYISFVHLGHFVFALGVFCFVFVFYSRQQHFVSFIKFNNLLHEKLTIIFVGFFRPNTYHTRGK